MRSIDIATLSPPELGQGERDPAVRTYRQIAEVLTENGNLGMTPTRVARICRDAETKIMQALSADPVVREWLEPGARRTH